jgi:hypothetical protein
VGALLGCEVRRRGAEPDGTPAAIVLHPRYSLGAEAISDALRYINVHTPTSQRVYEVLQAPLSEFFADIQAYDRAFDTFEYLLALVHVGRLPQNSISGLGGLREPLGRFARLNRRAPIGTTVVEEDVARVLGMEPNPAASAAQLPDWAVPLFGGSKDRLVRAWETLRARY